MSKSDHAVEIIAAQRPRVRLMGVLYEKKVYSHLFAINQFFFQKICKSDKKFFTEERCLHSNS